MAIYKHDIPILEHDDNPVALIMNNRHEVVLPGRAVYAFLGDTIDEYAAQIGAEVIEVFHTVSRDTSIYRVNYKGQELCLCRAPLGGSAAVQLMDFLIGHGVQSIISAGSCGALAPLPENAFLVPKKALRDEGASYHYLPPSRFVETSAHVRKVIEDVLTERGLKYAECTTWTTDGFYRETEDMVAYRREEGCLTVEMECASLAACARFRGVDFGQLLYTADSLADAQKYDARSWGEDSVEPALMLCLDIAAKL